MARMVAGVMCLGRSLRLGLLTYIHAGRSPSEKARRFGQRLRALLQSQGPVFIKFGQLLSIRRDLLPPELADELALLQDDVPPFASDVAKASIEQSLGQPLENFFQSFDMTPLAAASIAQVHAATLHNGHAVVVKVLRPHIKKRVARDMSLIAFLARIWQWFSPLARRLDVMAAVEELRHSLYDELDLMREAANASEFKRNLAQSCDLATVPNIIWELTSQNMLVQDRVFALPVHDEEALRKRGVNKSKLAKAGIALFFQQVFEHRFFHADMHPGNVFVDTTYPETPSFVLVDFGIMGTLSEHDQYYLAENFVAFFNRDYHRVARLHIESGWVPEGIREDTFASAIRTISEPIFARPLAEISIAQLLLRLLQTAQKFDMVIQPQLMLLQKTLLSVEGLGRRLDPKLNLWDTAQPYMEAWVRKQRGLKASLDIIRREASHWPKDIPELPRLLHQYLQKPPMRHRDKPRPASWRYFAAGMISGVGLAMFSYAFFS